MRLEKLKERAGVSDETIATHLKERYGVKTSRATVARWIKGESVPRLGDAIALADYFRVSLDELTGRTPTEPAGTAGRIHVTIDLAQDEATLDRVMGSLRSIVSSSTVPVTLSVAASNPTPVTHRRSASS